MTRPLTARARRAVALAVAAAPLALCLHAGTGAAHAARFPSALAERTFKVDVKGVQTTTWTLEHDAAGPCEPSTSGSGGERVVFRSRKPLRVTMKRYGTSYVVLGDPSMRGDGEIAARATATRNGHVTSSGGTGDCQDNGGSDTAPLPPDCGTRTTTFDVALDYENEPRHGFALTNGMVHMPGELFRRCPSFAPTTFPDLLSRQGRRAILAAIPPEDLFDRAYGQQIAIGRGVQRTAGGDVRSTTRIRWDVRLTAVKR